MTGPEARAIRERLGLRVEDLAGILALTPHVVEGWEAGAARVPREVARDLRWRDALAAREALYATHGVGNCEWVEGWSRRTTKGGANRLKDAFAELDAHAAGCPTCRARAELDATLPPLPEPPSGGGVRLIGRIGEWIERRPQWLHVPLWVGATFASVTILRVAVAVLATAGRTGSARILLVGLAAIPASAATGFVVGLVWTALKSLYTRLRR